jgi:NAD(P)-dependent dehydrogenase (short-subunit alcohol dehydrogenase family)
MSRCSDRKKVQHARRMHFSLRVSPVFNFISNSFPLPPLSTYKLGIALPLELFPLDKFRRVMEVNVMGVLAVTQAFIPRLRRDQGRIINVGSAAGFTVPPGYGAYSSSKFALEAISDAFRIELRPWNISVSLLEPGTIESEIRRKNLGEDLPFKGLSQEAYGLYRQMFDTYEARLMAMERKAGSAQLTTDAIVHALTSVTPQSRYVIGSYQGLSLGTFRRYIMPFLPDHVQDRGKIKALEKAPVAVAVE